MTAIVDSREPRAIVLAVALGLPRGEEVAVEELSAGDILLRNGDREMLIERKTPPDFLASISDGRLFQQAMRIKEACPRSLVLITGHIYPLPDGQVRAGAFRSRWDIWAVRMAMLRLQFAGVAVLEIGERDLVRMIGILFKWLGRVEKGVPPAAPDPLTPVKLQTWFLAQLPGIGIERARELLASYGSPSRALAAIESGEAKSVHGLGERTVQRAKEFLSGK